MVFVDSTRTGFVTFVPFLLAARGASVQTVGLALSLVFAGGAMGKFICGFLAERLGIVRTVILTEGLTAGAIRSWHQGRPPEPLPGSKTAPLLTSLAYLRCVGSAGQV